jgi:DoxX-like family
LTDVSGFAGIQTFGVNIEFESPSIKRKYVIALGIFAALFLGSAVFGLIDIDASYLEWRHLGYPIWTFYALTVGKVVGVVTIVTNRSTRLKQFAFAGFLYDLLLALGSHVAATEVKTILPLASLGIWGFAYFMDSRVFPKSIVRPIPSQS